jgi:hypothetical protein
MYLIFDRCYDSANLVNLMVGHSRHFTRHLHPSEKLDTSPLGPRSLSSPKLLTLARALWLIYQLNNHGLGHLCLKMAAPSGLPR